MEQTMLVARPLQAFRIGFKKVVVCHVAEANPNNFLGKELWFYCEGRQAGRIKIEGRSTATPNEGGPFDFSYSGEECATASNTLGTRRDPGPFLPDPLSAPGPANTAWKCRDTACRCAFNAA